MGVADANTLDPHLFRTRTNGSPSHVPPHPHPLIQVLTHWALIYCALTGESLWDGGRDTLTLFGNRGWSLIVNDDLVGIALAISNLMVSRGAWVGVGVGWQWGCSLLLQQRTRPP